MFLEISTTLRSDTVLVVKVRTLVGEKVISLRKSIQLFDFEKCMVASAGTIVQQGYTTRVLKTDLSSKLPC